MSQPPADTLLDQLTQGWRAYALIALIALCAALPGVGRMPVLDRDEARFTQATRQMLDTGDFVRIRLQDDDRNKKPIGIHWLQAAAVEAAAPFTAKTNTIWPYRLPSVFGAVLAALAAFWAGTALLDRRAAFLGASLFAATLLLGTEGMIAKTDAALAGFTTLAMAALAQLYAGKARPKALALLFWATMGAGVLIKGPVTPMVIGLSLLAIGAWERRAAWMKPLLWWPGPLIAVAIVAPWMIAIGQATNGAFFAEAIGGDLAPKIGGGHEGHFAWPGTHLALLPLLIFPATFALPAGTRLGWRTLRAGRAAEEFNGLRFLVAWAIPVFIVFELLPTKLAHYTLPAYPAIALICGAAVLTASRERWRFTTALGMALFVLAGAGVVALLAAGATFMPGDADADMRRAALAGITGGVVLLAAAVAMIVLRPPQWRVGAAIVAGLMLAFTLRERILPEARTLHVSVEAEAALTRARLLPTDSRPLWVVGYGEMSLVFLTRTDIRIAAPAKAAAGAESGDAMIVEARALDSTLMGLSQRDLVFETIGEPVEGRNYGNGDEVRLFVGRVAEPALTPATDDAAPLQKLPAN